MLKLRQILGIAALRNVEDITLIKRKQDLTLELTHLFSPLVSSDTENLEGLFEIIDFAVDLRNDITKELAIYSCYWFSADCKIDLDLGLCDFDGWRDEYSFLLCIFPGFSQSIKLHDGAIREVLLKPARIEMEW